MSNLLIAVDQRENARLLKGYLDQYYAVVVPMSEEEFDTPFDLGIFDGHALSRYLQIVQRRKHVEQPLFLPVLLITPRQDVTLITRHLWQSIDEIIFAPIEKVELLVRVEVLLRARQLSLELKGKNIHLETEIAAHQETTLSLQESEERFRAALKNSPIIVARTDRDLRYTWIYKDPAVKIPDLIGKRDDELVGLDNTQALMALKRAVLETQMGCREEIELTLLGDYKAYDVTVEPIIEGLETTGLRIVAVDITERKQAEHRLLKLYDLVIELSRSLTLEDVAERVIQYAMTILGATAGVVALLSDHQKTLHAIHSIGYPEALVQVWQNTSIDDSTMHLAVAMTSNRPLFYNPTQEGPEVLLSASEGFLEDNHKAWASMPLKIGDQLVGGIELSFSSPKIFDDAERGFMLTLAQQCAQALERVQLITQLQDAAVLGERHRLARDLHDAVSQTLFAAASIADSIPRMWERKPDRARELLQQVTSLNRGALAEMRTLLFELRPEALFKTDLKSLLAQLMEAIKARKMLETTLTVTGEPMSLTDEAHIALYRITQESLNNIIKHSQATQVSIALDYTSDDVTLQIIDNGRGFDVKQDKSGLGLGGMRERAEGVGATLNITSVLDQGTHVTLIWQRA